MKSLIERIVRRLCFELMKNRQVASPKKILSSIGAESTKILESSSQLISHYQYYVSHISRSDMAASLELSALILSLCETQSLRKMADLGSGFSSFVLRKYALRKDAVSVWSIDDDLSWLMLTRNYLHESNLSTHNLLLLEEFIHSHEDDFDFILLDLNFVEIRKNYIRMAVEKSKSGGYILFDDVHKREFMNEVLRQTKDLPVQLYDISDLTRDNFNRYAILAIKD